MTAGNPFRYQVLKSDFSAPTAYQINLLNTKDRVTVKQFKAHFKAKQLVMDGISFGYQGIIREDEHP